MGWLPSASDSNTSSSSNTNQYGTRSPVLSPQYNDIFNSYAKTLGFDPAQWASGGTAPATTTPGTAAGTAGAPATGAGYTGPNPQTVTGYNPTQTGAVNWMSSNLTNGPVDAATTTATTGLNAGQNMYGIVGNRINDIATSAAPQSAGTSMITPDQAAKYMASYTSPYTNDVVNTTLASYDKNTGDQLNALRAGRGAGSAFGDRANLSDSNFLVGSDLNRAQTEANLRNLGFTNALQPAEFDAGQNLQAQTTNAANTLNNNQFNANAQLQNKNIQNAANAQALQAIAGWTGISQQVLQNVVTANGIDTQAAQNLFNAGTISQAQLNALLDAAGSTNGSSFTQNTNTNSNSNTLKLDTGTII